MDETTMPDTPEEETMPAGGEDTGTDTDNSDTDDTGSDDTGAPAI